MKRVGWVLNEISILKLTVKASQISGGIEREKVHLVGGALNVTIPNVMGTIMKIESHFSPIYRSPNN